MATLSEALRQKAKGKKDVLGEPWGDWICDEAADALDAMEAALVAGLSAFEGMTDGDGNEAPELDLFRAALAKLDGNGA